MEKETFNLGYDPQNPLYQGVSAQKADGRWNIENSQQTLDLVKTNARAMAAVSDNQVAFLTGPTAMWIAAGVAVALANHFKQVIYNDGRGFEVVLASKF